MPRRPVAASVAIVTAFVLVGGAITLLPGAAPEAAAEGLVPYDSCGDLLAEYREELERTATPWGFGFDWGRGDMATSAVGRAAAPQAAGGESADSGTFAAGGSGPTGTNLQESGVDEPDLAKTVGDLLFAVGETSLQVVRTGAQPELLSSTSFGREAWGAELLVDGDRVLVLAPQGNSWGHPAASSSRIMPVGPQSGTVSLILFDVSDPSAPRVLEELQVDGRYLSARLSDGAVRLVTSSVPTPEAVQPAEPYEQEQLDEALAENRKRARGVGLADVLPHLERRTADGRVLEQGQALRCGQVRHAPATAGASTLLVTTLDLQRGLEPQDRTGVTTDGDLVYASAGRLYVATSRWGTTAPATDDTRSDSPTAVVEQQVTTELHGFDTSAPDRTSYVGSGSVPGYVIGRWALSSYDGHLRVATTSAPPWQGETPSSSSVVVLEEQPDGLAETGRVDGLGVGERIFAVRYFGDLATVVTFRQTDPLYVLDLADPAAPKLLGELKIPGFSTYLHPVGDDLLLGVGMDATDQGQVTGAQVSLFDLSDRSSPIQVDRLSLGQGSTAAGEDSRAFGYDTASRTALMPFSTWDGIGSSTALGVRVEGQRLVLAGRMPIAAAPAERVLHDGAHLYAVSRLGVVAGSLESFERTGAVVFRR